MSNSEKEKNEKEILIRVPVRRRKSKTLSEQPTDGKAD